MLQPDQNNSIFKQLLQVPIVVAALGYFVDVYDLLLFSIVRIPSLKAIDITDTNLLADGAFLINMQMAGMLVGGIFWGILGDKKGRLSVLFGSILLYSLANIANGFVTSLNQYAVLRFIAGIGLAGELGAGITLVAEILPKNIRGYGTTLVASIGVLGAILAYFIADMFNWKIAYFIGGGLGLALLLLRVGVFESGMFKQVKETEVAKGEINHKLACATGVNAFQEHVFPAIWTDGFIEGGIPEGSVIQLDPSLDLSKFNLYPEELAIAKAMQKYGMVVVDIAGANTLYGEGLWGHPGKSWDGKVREIDGGISSIPLDYYRVLKINNRVKKGDSYTKILHAQGLW